MQLLRLKQALGVTDDQSVAEALGLSKAAFSDRKRRDAFPEDKLFALAAKRPELRLDARYVLTGMTSTQEVRARMEALPSRVTELRGDMKVEEFAKRVGLPVKAVQMLEAGRVTLTIEQLGALVKAFPDRSPSWIAGGPRPQLDEELSDIEVILVRNYRQCPKEVRELIRETAAREAQKAAVEETPSIGVTNLASPAPKKRVMVKRDR